MAPFTRSAAKQLALDEAAADAARANAPSRGPGGPTASTGLPTPPTTPYNGIPPPEASSTSSASSSLSSSSSQYRSLFASSSNTSRSTGSSEDTPLSIGDATVQELMTYNIKGTWYHSGGCHRIVFVEDSFTAEAIAARQKAMDEKLGKISQTQYDILMKNMDAEMEESSDEEDWDMDSTDDGSSGSYSAGASSGLSDIQEESSFGSLEGPSSQPSVPRTPHFRERSVLVEEPSPRPLRRARPLGPQGTEIINTRAWGPAVQTQPCLPGQSYHRGGTEPL